tara:strand:+ start:54 stop:641 length:588 start_codon:yes stop_codon:yes gene_type:complete
MKTIQVTPKEMERYIARFADLVPNKARTGDRIPEAAREALTARSTKTVIAHSEAGNTPWGAGGDGGPIPGPKDFAVVIAECEPHNGPGLHSHAKSTETFTCIQGRFRIEWGDEGENAVELGLFDTISVPPGVMRRFQNISDEVGLLYVILQGGERGLGDVEYAPGVGRDIRERFGDGVMKELESVGYSFDAGLEN